MGVKLQRRKKRSLLLSVIYKLSKLPVLSRKQKFRLFLDLEWIFNRLCHESSFMYYRQNEHPMRRSQERFISMFINKSHQVLDLGCNNGVLSAIIAKYADGVTAIDNQPVPLAKAIKENSRPNIEYREADALEYLRKNNRRFDVLVLSHILEHLDEPERLMNEFKGYFKYIYIEFPDFESSFLNQYRKDLGNTLIYTDDDHIHEWDRREAITMIEHCGLKIADAQYVSGMQQYWCLTENAYQGIQS